MDVLAEPWELSLLVQRVVQVTLAIGLVVTLVLAWYHGEKGQQRVTGRELVILTVVLALGGGLLAALGDSDTPPQSQTNTEGSALEAIPPPREGINRVPLILADFENHTTDPHLALMTTEALRVDLGGSAHLALLGRGALEAALRRMEVDASAPLTRDVAVEIAHREGIPFVVAGSVDAIGGAIQFLAELIRPGQETSGGGRRVVANDSTQILTAIGDLSRGIRQDAGETASSIAESDPLPQVTTGSLEALRLYARAVQLGDQNGEYRRAAGLLEQAVAVDSSFAMGYRKLGAYLSNAGIDRARSIDSFRKAFLLRDRLSEPERLLAEIGYYSDVKGNVTAMLQVARTMVELYPDDGIGLNNLGWAYGAMGVHEQSAEAYERAAEISPDFLYLWNLAQQQLALGHFDLADMTFTRLSEVSQGSWTVLWGRAQLDWARGDYASAEERMTSLEAPSRADPSVRRRLLGLRRRFHRRRGQGRPALAAANELYQLRVEEGDPGAALTAAALMANLHSRLLEDRTAAAAVLDNTVRAHPSDAVSPYDYPYLALIQAYAWAGRPEDGRRLMAEYEQRVPSGEAGSPDGTPGVKERIISQMALAEGDAGQAVQLLRQALGLNCYPARCTVLMAEAHDAAARPDSALAWYERYLGMPLRLNLDDAYLAPTLERLAQLQDEHGDPARAEELYARFVDLWEEADPELQPRVEAARARLAR
jgi:tetratricopeptide (TPR) repeat protein